MNLFDFTEEDLKLNQRGRVSSRQRQWLNTTARGIRSMSGMNTSIAVIFVFLGLCITLGLYPQNEDSRAALFANPLNLLVFPVTVFIVAVILALSIFFAHRQANRLAGAQIQSAQGQIRLAEEHGEGGITYYVFVGKKKFAFGEDMSRVFRDGEKYKVYYCKSGVYEKVLSHEKLEA